MFFEMRFDLGTLDSGELSLGYLLQKQMAGSSSQIQHITNGHLIIVSLVSDKAQFWFLS